MPTCAVAAALQSQPLPPRTASRCSAQRAFRSSSRPRTVSLPRDGAVRALGKAAHNTCAAARPPRGYETQEHRPRAVLCCSGTATGPQVPEVRSNAVPRRCSSVARGRDSSHIHVAPDARGRAFAPCAPRRALPTDTALTARTDRRAAVGRVARGSFRCGGAGGAACTRRMRRGGGARAVRRRSRILGRAERHGARQ